MSEPYHYCRACGGEGRVWMSRHGGNDPDVWDAGPCENCGGSGNAWCEECGNDYATLTWHENGREYLLCGHCHARWTEDATA
jgi:hypothetical protein